MHLHDGCSQQPALIRRLSTHAAPSNFKELMNFMIKVGPIVAVLTSVGGSVIYLTNVVRSYYAQQRTYSDLKLNSLEGISKAFTIEMKSDMREMKIDSDRKFDSIKIDMREIKVGSDRKFDSMKIDSDRKFDSFMEVIRKHEGEISKLEDRSKSR